MGHVPAQIVPAEACLTYSVMDIVVRLHSWNLKMLSSEVFGIEQGGHRYGHICRELLDVRPNSCDIMLVDMPVDGDTEAARRLNAGTSPQLTLASTTENSIYATIKLDSRHQNLPRTLSTFTIPDLR
jgi:hypothetical protein